MTRLTAQFVEIAGFILAVVIFLGSAAGFGGRAVAGEPIVFGTEKIKAEPGKDKAPTQGPFRLEKLTAPPPFELNGLTPPILPRSNSSHRKDKRQQNAEDEKKNWLLLDQGELQDKDDEKNFLGVRDDGLDDLDKSKDSHDYTFRPNNSSRNPNQLRVPGQSQARLPGQRQKADANRPPPSREDADTDADTKRASGNTAILFGSRDTAIGARVGSGSGLRGLLDAKVNGQSSRSDFSLRDFLGNGDSERSREQQARAETFKNRILGNGSSAPGLSDPINTHPDFTRQPLNPVMPSGFGDSGPKSFSASPDFSPRQSVAQPNNPPMNYLGSPDLGVGPSGLGPSQPSSGSWRSTPVDWQRPRF